MHVRVNIIVKLLLDRSSHTLLSRIRLLHAVQNYPLVFCVGYDLSDSDVIEADDILALAAVVKLNLSPQQRYPRSSPNFLQQSQSYLPRSSLMMTFQFFIVQAPSSRSPHVEARVQAQLEFHSRPWHAWADNNCSSSDGLGTTRKLSFILQVAAHVQSSPISFHSTTSQNGATTWFVSIVLWVLLSAFAMQ